MTKGKVAGIAVGVLAVAVVALLVATGIVPIAPPPPTPPPPPVAVKEFSLSGGEVTPSRYGFALEGDELSSPGPTLRASVGDTVRITFTNVGELPHAFYVVEVAEEGAEEIFGATIGSATAPLLPGESGTVEFTPTRAGTFAYMCPVPGHVTLGMWGELVVEE